MDWLLRRYLEIVFPAGDHVLIPDSRRNCIVCARR
uniref:Uncharacterized protein n=1 Tax=Human cytomegalovirus TaxID=10359 RepID=Q69212_HCMV|nr:unknown protein [Human betaherpesvirus 5]